VFRVLPGAVQVFVPSAAGRPPDVAGDGWPRG
jgi:hypothetical protein